MMTVLALSLIQMVTLLVVYAIVKATQPSDRWWRVLTRLGRRHVLAILVCGGLTLVISVSVSLIRWPVPSVHDEFSYLLASDTFASGRLTNPTHPMWPHFETFHVIQQPTYASKYPPAQGILLAIGQRLGDPVAGIWIGNALAVMCGCWMLQGWLPSRWAFLGGILLAFHPIFQLIWGQGFMGPAAAIAGGALLLGALPRIRKTHRPVTSVALVAGLVLLANSRPFEGFVLSLAVAACLLGWFFSKHAPPWLIVARDVVAPTVVTLIVAGAAMGFYNRQVTHNPLKMPYQIHEETYAVSPLFLWKPLKSPPEFRHDVMKEFQLGWALDAYRKQSTPAGFIVMKSDMVLRAWYYIIGPALTIPLLFALPLIRRGKFVFLFAASTLVLVATILVPWTLPHYLAPVLPACLAVIVLGMRRLRIWKRHDKATGKSLFLAIVIAYGVVTLAGAGRCALTSIRGWQFARLDVIKTLNHAEGQHLVVVRYRQNHDPLEEWVYNAADIDAAKIVWAREMKPADNARLLDYFQNRRIWLLDADAEPPGLVEHVVEGPEREAP